MDSNLLPFVVKLSIALLFANTGRPLNALNLSLVSPTTSELPVILGSMMKLRPLSLLGGREPVVIYLSTSMIVYLSLKLLSFPNHFSPISVLMESQIQSFAKRRGCSFEIPKYLTPPKMP